MKDITLSFMTNPKIPEQFLPFEGWKSDHFSSPKTKHRIQYSYAFPEGQDVKGTVVALPGLSEFGEKYIETARFFIENGYAFYVIDWCYQGNSTRLDSNRHKRHSDGFDADVEDLHHLVTEIIADTPKFMLAHSMGANLGLRYLLKHPETFQSTALSAPMVGINDIKWCYHLVHFILRFMPKTNYIPGGHDWQEDARKSDGTDIFSNDPIRDQLHNYWCLRDHKLQVGSPTVQWLRESVESILLLNKKHILEKIKTPMVIGLAEKEALIDNEAITKVAAHLPHARLIRLDNAKHEIMMETDHIRLSFLNTALELFSLK